MEDLKLLEELQPGSPCISLPHLKTVFNVIGAVAGRLAADLM
jgi:hypothetical protein